MESIVALLDQLNDAIEAKRSYMAKKRLFHHDVSVHTSSVAGKIM